MHIKRRATIVFAAATMVGGGLLAAAPAHAEDSIIRLVSQQNGKCLQPVNRSLSQGDAIVQRTCNGSVEQQWFVRSVSATKLHLENRRSRLCLNARGRAVNGTPIQQWTCNRISNENWSFGITNNLLVSGVSNTFSHCIATPGNVDGLPMELRFCDANISQRWSRPPG